MYILIQLMKGHSSYFNLFLKKNHPKCKIHSEICLITTEGVLPKCASITNVSYRKMKHTKPQVHSSVVQNSTKRHDVCCQIIPHLVVWLIINVLPEQSLTDVIMFYERTYFKGALFPCTLSFLPDHPIIQCGT